ncbi:hypothetical protein PENSOL_c009G05928 [Penicillium solitum]|uniref:Uncharacterized protein n=1 Tax=Penicillium solitum TaxID=60172 RepID=A0A1V6RA67_9EURO|nr:uncharacterized protein PENSOL_c009G05928 [Penicillium solitum]OQD98428.1 hypothetical protein PENSOL_c009G05928 [Penicillium solitum]
MSHHYEPTQLNLVKLQRKLKPKPTSSIGSWMILIGGKSTYLIHVATISRGQNKVPCRFTMNRNPTAYALVYQSKDKKDLAYTRLQDLEGFTERVCGDNHDFPDLAFTNVQPYDAAYQVIPESYFDGDTFTYGRPFPNQDPPV